MAVLILENGESYIDLKEIQRELEPLNVKLNTWKIDESHHLLTKPQLNETEQITLLESLDHYFYELKKSEGYRSRDLIVLHEQTLQLEELLAKFDKCHTHDDDEVRFIVDGSGVFGFVRPDGSQVELKVSRGDYINIPSHTEHWFYLTDQRRIKAVRYFIGTEGWVPQYTGTEIRIR